MDTMERKEKGRTQALHPHSEEVGTRCGLISSVRTIAPCIAVFSQGILKAIVGATLLQLQYQTASSTEQISSLFLFMSVGLVSGNVLIALYYRLATLRVEYALCAALLILGLVDLYIPWCTSFSMLAIAFGIHGLSYGFCGGGGAIPYLLQTWKENAGSYLQLFVFVHSAGATVTPYIVGQFLADPPKQKDEVFHISELPLVGFNNSEDTLGRGNFRPPDKSVGFKTTTENFTTDDTHTDCNIRASNKDVIPPAFVPFLIPVTGLLIAAIFYVIASVIDKKVRTENRSDFRKESTAMLKENVAMQKEEIPYVLAALAFCFGIFIGGIEATYGGWIIAFGVEHLGSNYSSIAWAATLFWFGETIGRLIAFLGANRFPLKRYLGFLITLLTLSNFVFVCTYHLHGLFRYICSFVTGMALSPMLGLYIMFVQSASRVPEWLSSVLHISLYVGSMSIPCLVGLLFANISPVAFLYVLVACSLLQGVLFIFMVICSKNLHKEIQTPNSLAEGPRLLTLRSTDIYASQISIN